MHLSQGHYVDGRWLLSQGEAFTAINPATDEVIWKGNMATPDALAQALQSANKALPGWSALPFETRITHLEQFIEQVNRALPLLIRKLAEETGKPLWEATTELKGLSDKLHISIEAFKQRCAQQHYEQSDQTLRLQFKPLGVVAVLGAFNFPIHLSHGHLIPALLAGNTAIFKPSELTPAIAEAIVGCWHDSGLPSGVLNLVQGDGNTASALLSMPIQAVYFTGSYQTGCAIQASMRSRPDVLLALEMGGNNPLIVDEVQDLDAAVYHALVSSFITAGQRCSCTRRLILPDTPFGKRFLERFISAAAQLNVGPFDAEPAPFMGPVIRLAHAHHALEKQKQRHAEGATSLLTMQRLGQQGAFLSPGILDMTNASTHVDEEIFAPLVQVYRYKDFETALTLANQTQYGLAAGLFSDSAARYAQFASQIRAGVLSWNRPTTGASARLPFGGIGHSGNHRPSAFFAADYCVYPVASLEQSSLKLPLQRMPGVTL